ncbi:hypothetical protein BBJ28_00012287 [Nothophytophthora sp. Chile5]|nr:hypothetical protein BBJ28_00012287 [Nothophytophthora sp. Chile5]
MDPNAGEALPWVIEQRNDSSTSLPASHGTRTTSERLSNLDERLDQMQAEIHATHRMMRELNTLMHRQLQVRALSFVESNAPSNYSVLGGPSLRSIAAGSFDPSHLLPSDAPEAFSIGSRYFGTDSSLSNRTDTLVANRTDTLVANRTDTLVANRIDTLAVNRTDTRTESTFAVPPPVPPLVSTPSSPRKKMSIGLAVLNSELAALRRSVAVSRKSNTDVSTREALVQQPAKTRSGIMQFLQQSKVRKAPDYQAPPAVAEYQEGKVTRRFSVTSMNMPKPAAGGTKNRLKSMFVKGNRNDATVSPEDIQSARNLDGEVKRFTLRHDTQHRYVWDMLIMAMILLDVILTPLSLGFDYTPHYLDALNSLGTVLFVVDFIIHMLSSFTDERGDLISGPRRTAANYLLSGWALPDFLSWFPFDQFASSSQGRVFGFTKIFRLAKVSQLARKLHSAKKAGILRFILLMGIVLTVVHLLACYWHWVAVGWREHLADGSFVPGSLVEEYALCWSLIIGCLNASPPSMFTAIEQVSVATFMLIGNVLQASVFGSVAVLISSFDEDEAAYNKKLITTSERCRFLGIPNDLADRIRGYYENLWRETKSVSSDADAFINELSPALICEVKFQLYRDMLTQIPFLSAQKLAPTVIEMLILHLRTVIYMQDDVLIRKGEFGDWMGFIGSKGSVGVLDPSSEARRIIRILRKGDYFGEMALLQRAKRSTTAVALTWVQIHVLCRNDLDSVKEQYPTQTEILESEINKYMQSKVRYK